MESSQSASSGRARPKVDPIRKFLFKLSKSLVTDDIAEIKFLANLPDGVSEKTDTAIMLFAVLMKRYRTEQEFIECLKEIFSEMNRGDVIQDIEQYEKQNFTGPCPSPSNRDSFSSSSSPHSLVSSTTLSLDQAKETRTSAELIHSESLPSHLPTVLDKDVSIQHGCFMSGLNSASEGGQILLEDERSSGRSVRQNTNLSCKEDSKQLGDGERCLLEKSQSDSELQAVENGHCLQRRLTYDGGTLQSVSPLSVSDESKHIVGETQFNESEPSKGRNVETPVKKVMNENSTPGIEGSLPRNDSETELKQLPGAVVTVPRISEIQQSAAGEESAGHLELQNSTSLNIQGGIEQTDLDADGPESPEEVSPKMALVSSASKESGKATTNLDLSSYVVHSKSASAPGLVSGKLFANTNQFLELSRELSGYNVVEGKIELVSNTVTGNLGVEVSEDSPVVRGFSKDVLRNLLRGNIEKEAKPVIMRKYQKELARPGMDGKNSIICSPTGSGKTLTAGFICQYQRMNAAAERRPFKTLFIVCIRNLIIQQRDALSQIVVSEDNKEVVTGLRDNSFLSECINQYDVTVLTAQILVNCLRSGEVKLSDIDLLIMDECHHTTQNHPYNAIMLEYHRFRKANPMGKLPQIIGLTASLGVGSTGNDVLTHYIQLCANLDCLSITHVRQKEHLDELLLHTPKPKKDQIISVEPRAPKSAFSQILSYMMSEIEKITYFPVAAASYSPGCQQYENWVVQQRREAESKGLVDTILCAEILQRLNCALMIYDELRARDAMRYLDAHFAEILTSDEQEPSASIKKLYSEARQDIQDILAKEQISDNPKLRCLCTLLVDLFMSNKDARGIVLAKTRLSIEVLCNCIKELPELRGLAYPVKLVGQGGKEGRMTDVEQENALRRFRQGKEGPNGGNLLIATDVAQEGLDMPKCNFVVRYNFVSNEIGSVQSRGRARAPNSECYLIVERNSINEVKEYANLEKEHQMLQALEDIDDIGEEELIKAIRNAQFAILDTEERKQLERQTVSRLLDANNITIHCRSCLLEFCCAADLRVRMNNYICIAVEELLTKIFVKRLDKPDEYRFDSKTGLCFCTQCKKIVGHQLQYKQGARRLGYVLSKGNVMWRHGNEATYNQIKKWSSVPFEIREEQMFPLQ